MTELSLFLDSDFLHHEHYAVLGAGKSGVAAAGLLLDLGKRVSLYDDWAEASQPALQALAERGADLRLCEEAGRLESGVQAVVTSPGLAADHRLLTQVRLAGLPVIGELELGWLFKGNARVVAITGTNGKTTVTMLIQAICEAAGWPSVSAGNIGLPLCDAVRQQGDQLDQTVFSVEVSSFQLETVEHFCPDVALVLNVTPDHLDRHGTMEDYARTKQHITAKQGPEQTLVLNQDDPLCLPMSSAASAQVRRFSLERAVPGGAWLDGDLMMLVDPQGKTQRLMSIEDLQLDGLHNVANALAAAAACSALGVGRKVIAQALAAFKAAPHRLENVGERAGVRFINDSKATNLGAMVKAIESFEGGIHLIAGGRDKASPFEQVTGLLAARATRVYLIGEAAADMRRAWGDSVPCTDSGTMARALEEASAQAQPGQIVLLAPGCASFDQFKSYADRGDQFRRWVQDYLTTHPAEKEPDPAVQC